MSTAGGRPSPGDRVARWEAGAFGLNFGGEVCVLGLSGDGSPQPGRGLARVELQLIDSIADRGEADRVVAGAPGGLMIEALAGGGHRMTSPGVGEAEIQPGAGRVLIGPPLGDGWQWNRWVLGQVLPFAAALHGRELLHAGGVVLGGQGVAILAPSGIGKSTLVAALLEQGAAFLSDDVIALTAEAGAVLAHPGPGVLGVIPPRFQAPVPAHPLSTVCLLELAQEDRVQALAEPSAGGLLANVYERVRRDPQRLAGLLSLLADVAAGARFVRIQRGRSSDPHELASALVRLLAG